MKKITFLLILIAFVSCDKSQEKLSIMTYNIRYGNANDGKNHWHKRKEFLSDQINYYHPDIFGIQEGLQHQVHFLDSVLVDYNYIGVGRDDGKTKGEYSAIFYNSKSFTAIENNTFWLSETPSEISVGWDAAMERICTYGLFENVTTKQQFYVFNTHFDHIGTQARIKSAELIIEKITEFNLKNLPVMLMGDLNLTPEAKPIQLLSKVLNDSKSISKTKPFGPIGTFNGFKFNKPVTDRIDYIFTSRKNITVEKYAVLSDSKNCKYPSDHLPVFVEVSIN
ncbi:endonuclease/exonuclease/phosphatase family protein [Lutibacter sp. A80]|uniref:endonuclease/exonuclease/phosphatase family protein n=1 Tax=Lutibacter sp. A80 TaxID=2918453 RepID=UPI001F055D00|nr:endonuclease/exonuclease/phosphatase family protein [Lutibacter sp. A80]UMB61945.1 endonuclease/exonuclease/phosphatase family protein [Lutibacter sp. A80]